MNILYYDNCWFTNVGEAFIDIGTMSFLRELFPSAHIANISNMSNYYVPEIENRKFGIWKGTPKKNKFNLCNIVKMFNYDVLVLAGMFMSGEHLKGDVSKFVRESAAAGKKVVFLGLGADSDITNSEISDFRDYLNAVNPMFVLTRDKKTYYRLQENRIYPLVLGIDMAFWCKDFYDPRGFAEEKYDIITFNRSSEPDFELSEKNNIVRPWHMQWGAKNEKFKKDTYISDIPFDYLSLYANADKVYTDLVHATIVSLQYGKKVRFFPVDDRRDAVFDMDILNKDCEGYIWCTEKELENKKREIFESVKKIWED